MIASIIDEFEEVNAAREQAIAASRHVVRASANAIKAAHRSDFEQARTRAHEASHLLAAMVALTSDHAGLASAGYVQDAMKEVAEAHLSIAMLDSKPLPTFADLAVAPSAWLNGLAEAASELRRDALDSLRRNEVAQAESHLQTMDSIYNALVTIDFPDAITGGIRRTTDQLRAVLERTRGDVTFALRQDRLEHLLASTETSLSKLQEPSS